jgi:(1->4)-alpha-D-glucan 1-alpha-D-glucosylmutase
VLEDQYGRVLEKGLVRIERSAGRFVVRYHDHVWPVAPRSIDAILFAAADRTGSDELAFLAGAHDRLPSSTATDVVSLRRRHRDKEVLRRLVERLCREDREVARAIDDTLEALSADPTALHELLERQNYRVSFWRTATRELGYRRFFDVNTLAGLRVEVDRVFLDTHALVLGWLQDGTVDGLRVDHPDGLRDPEAYLARLQAARPGTWVVVEKILEPGERLPESWPVHGTTGYDFMTRLTALFVDPQGEAALTRTYADLTGESAEYGDVLRARKMLVLEQILGSDLNRLAALFLEVCERHPRHRDYTRHDLHQALKEVIADFPVYRTYVTDAGEARPEDVRHVDEAVAAARAHRPDLDAALFDFLRDLLVGRVAGDRERELTLRFQQVTGPAMAKGAEDTAFYVYNRLVALNEVGGDPSRFGLSLDAFHEACAEAQRRWPRALLATSTHDSKRSEDVRARIGLLAEVPQAWDAAARRWMDRNRRHWDATPPDRNLEYLLYQTLVGAWPIERERLHAYVEKAAREAKTRTSWTAPDAAYEKALRAFVDAVLDDRAFVSDLEAFIAPIVEEGRTVSLAQALVKLTAPGVPDVYQGCELWSYALVDPDNRRPVDYDARRALLRDVRELDADAVRARAAEGAPKLWLTWHALRVRGEHPEAFGPDGDYAPLRAEGDKADHVVAYARGGRVAVVVPRFPLRLRGAWGASALPLPPGRWADRLGGEEFTGRAPLAALLRRFPVALLVRDDGPRRR